MIRKWLSFRTLSIALALVLLVSAALKLHLLLTDPFADIKTGTSLPLLWLAVFAEVGVIWIVFSKVPVSLKWLSLTSLFGILTAASSFNVLAGKTSCGCFGAIEIHPVWLLTFNMGVIIMLVTLRTGSISKVLNEPSIPLTTLGQVVGFAVAAVVFVLFQTPPARAFVRSHFLGHNIEAVPIQLGTIQLTDKLNCELQLRNHSDLARKIVGVGKSCACVVPQQVVRSSIPENGTLEIAVEIKPKTPGPFHHRVLFYLDSPRQHVVAADLFGKIE